MTTQSEVTANEAAIPGSLATTSTESDAAANSPYQDRFLTIPNLICLLRLLGSIALFGVALMAEARLFAGLFTVLSLSDWIDGKLARWLNQRSAFGARFDSFADSVLYGALFFGLFWLRWDVLKPESAWWIIAILSYVLTTSFGLWKFGKIPSYHTYGAKISHWLILGGALSLLLNDSIWPLRIAMLAVTATNLEATAMTWILKEWRADVLTILHMLPGHKAKPGSDTVSRN